MESVTTCFGCEVWEEGIDFAVGAEVRVFTGQSERKLSIYTVKCTYNPGLGSIHHYAHSRRGASGGSYSLYWLSSHPNLLILRQVITSLPTAKKGLLKALRVDGSLCGYLAKSSREGLHEHLSADPKAALLVSFVVPPMGESFEIQIIVGSFLVMPIMLERSFPFQTG